MYKSSKSIVNLKAAASKRCACWFWCCMHHTSGKGLLYLLGNGMT